MKIDILTLFPDTVNAVLHESIIGRACNKGILEINCHQIRDYTDNKQNQVDDYPYGGGWGCIMMAQPLKSCLDSILPEGRDEKTRVIYMTPQGKPYTEETAKRLSSDYNHIVLVCGHYEGIDERFIEKCVDEEISIGDFVLTGGEIAAMAVADSVCRLIPGVLSDEECYTGESHWNGLLEYPQYTRPEVWENMKVPDVLLDGNKAKVDSWRYKQMLIRTRDKRPDMFEKLTLTKEDQKLIEKNLSGDVCCRKAEYSDLHNIVDIMYEGKELLKKRKIPQWLGDYPNEDMLKDDISRGELYVATVNENIAAFYLLTGTPEPSYLTITDGKWSSDEPYMTIHRMAVTKKYRGTGLSDIMMKFAEKKALEDGFKYLRADTHKTNKSMQKLLRESGFVYRGNVIVDTEPDFDPSRYAFEKRVKLKK